MAHSQYSEAAQRLIRLYPHWAKNRADCIDRLEQIAADAEKQADWPCRALSFLLAALSRQEMKWNAAPRYDAALAACDTGLQAGLPLHNSRQVIARLRDQGQRPTRSLLWQGEKFRAICECAGEMGYTQIEARSANQAGISLRSQGRNQEALSYLERSYKLALELKDKEIEGGNLVFLASIRHQQGDWQAATHLRTRCLELAQQTGNTRRIYLLRVTEALALQEEGRLSEAADALTRLVQIPRKERDSQRWNEARVALGGIYREMGELARAYHHLAEAVAWFRSRDMPGHLADALWNLESVYALLGQPKAREECSAEAERVVRRADYPIGKLLAMVSRARLARARNEMDVAASLLRQALAGFESFSTLSYSVPVALELTDTLLQNRRCAEAQAVLARLDRIAVKSLPRSLELRRDVLRGEFLLAAGDGATARQMLTDTLERSERYGLLTEKLRILTDLGAASLALKRDSEAEDYFQRAARQMQSLRATVPEYLKFQIGFGRTRQQYFLPYLTMLLQRKRFADAFRLVQQLKARALLDHWEGAGQSDEERAIPAPLQEEFRRANTRLMALIASLTPDDSPRMKEARTAFQKAERAVEAKVGAADAKQTVTVESGTARLPHLLPGDLLIEFMERGDRMQILLAGPGQNGMLTYGSYSVPREPLQTSILALEKKCYHQQPWQETAAYIGSLLFGRPVAPPDCFARVAAARRLFVCPSAEVWRLPFAVLLLPGSDRPLGFTKPIVYNHSATVLANAQQRARQMPRRAGNPLVVTGPSPADFTEPQSLEKRYGLDVSRMEPLVTAPEVGAIRRSYPSASVLSGKTASRDRIMAALPAARFLHFATHAFINDAAPLYSVLLVAPSGGDTETGPLLTAREMMHWDLRGIEAAVLSSCHSGQGTAEAAEGLVGFAWAILSAGCPTLAGTFWKLSQYAAPFWTSSFYQQLQSGKGAGAAAHLASAALREKASFQAPYHWAVFRVFGDAGPADTEPA